MWTSHESQKVCVRPNRPWNAHVNDAVAMVTHRFPRVSRAKSALISIKSFSGWYRIRSFVVSDSTGLHRAQAQSFWSGICQDAQSFSFDTVGSVEAATLVPSSVLLCRLDVRQSLERTFSSEGISCLPFLFGWRVLPVTNWGVEVLKCCLESVNLCVINFCSLLWNTGFSHDE